MSLESTKPRHWILTSSKEGDDTFQWWSDGWYSVKNRGSVEAQDLMIRALDAIRAGTGVADVIRRLEAAGFGVQLINETEEL